MKHFWKKQRKPMAKVPLSARLWIFGIWGFLTAILYYFLLPPIYLKSKSFWYFIFFIYLIYLLVKGSVCYWKNIQTSYFRETVGGISLAIIFGLGMISSLTLFHAKTYSKILTVTEGDETDIPSVQESSSIALMDTESAKVLGDREIGSLRNVVSQFDVGDYVQIDDAGKPIKVAPLAYESFFKWFGNHKQGIPGFVKVDPVDMSASYVDGNGGMRYVPSAYFQEDLTRYIRFHYPTMMFERPHFEVDDQGQPWYIAPQYDHTISLFGGKQVVGAIFVDPIHGAIHHYSMEEIPSWADLIVDGDLICQQYNHSAQLHRGFFNSIFGQVDCKEVTTIPSGKDDDYALDYGYVSKDGDIWVYTGVTSVNGDSSNLGFIMSNERTHETKFIPSSGADEFSAMKSAEGEVQEKGYRASFPSLINIDGNLTYIMVLKDANNLVKLYACVNVEQYNMVATAPTQKEAITKYRKLMQSGDGEYHQENAKEILVQVAKIEKIDIDGNTYLYLVDENQHVYKAKYADVIEMMFVQVGDTITIETDGNTFKFIR